VLASLLIGKPIGIWAIGMLAAKPMGLGLPDGMTGRDLFTLGCVAAIGFTVALFVASNAFPTGNIQDTAKMGALLSLAPQSWPASLARGWGLRNAMTKRPSFPTVNPVRL